MTSNQTVIQPTEENIPVTALASPSTGEYLQNYFTRIRSGDIASLPIIVGLAAIAIVFGALEPLFFSPRNFVNLLLQMSGITTLAIGVVFVLLIAEIDLSVAYVSAVGAVITALLLQEPGPAWPQPLAIGAGLFCTTAIGLFHGLVITKAKVPSFVVTLAGLLGWSGVVLILTTEMSTTGVIVIQDPVVLGIANAFLPRIWGWVLFAVIVGGSAILELGHGWLLHRQNLPAQKPFPILIARIAGAALITGAMVWFANQDRGVPVVTVIVLGLLAFWGFIARRTRFGRYVYAVGSNPEAVRRAGIDVDRIRIKVFMISGFMAGVGGIILASRLRSVDTNSGGSNLLLLVIAAAVIGGTSLFGGRGGVICALIGALIIAAVENGMGLLGLPSGVKFVVTSLVLLAAVLIDSFSRHNRETSGLG